MIPSAAVRPGTCRPAKPAPLAYVAHPTVPPEDVGPNGWFYLAIIPECAIDPGYPGGNDWYERKVTLQA